MTPQNLQVQANGGLSILWSDTGAVLNPCTLRWHCRCSACRRLWVQGLGIRVEPDLQLVNVSPVGSYGVQLRFSDGHDHGVFPWTYLRELAGLSASKDADDSAGTASRAG